MKTTRLVQYAVMCGALLACTAANAFFFFFIPIPSYAKPPQLDKIIDALEQSSETKAVAYVSEDKTFGSKYWVWGQYSGRATQEEANRIALAQCEGGLNKAKNETVGGKPLYDYGKKACELYAFKNKTVLLPEPVQQTPIPATPAEPAPPALAVAPSPAPVAVAPAPVEVAPAVSAAASQAQNEAKVTPATESSTARRLRDLNDLLKNGLITESEYKEKKKAILDSM